MGKNHKHAQGLRSQRCFGGMYELHYCCSDVSFSFHISGNVIYTGPAENPDDF